MNQITLDPVKAKDLQVALLQREIVQLRAAAMMKEIEMAAAAASTRVQAAMAELGLDPAQRYNIDYDKGTATLIEQQAV